MWIADQSGGSVPITVQDILNNPTAVASVLHQWGIQYAFVKVGYYDVVPSPYSVAIGLNRSTATYETIITAFHNVGIQVIAWVESDTTFGQVDIVNPTNLAMAYLAISTLMGYSWDGYNDDNEYNNGTAAQVASYLNGLNSVVHAYTLGLTGGPKKVFACLGTDNSQTMYSTVAIDAIVVMFYGATAKSKFEETPTPTEGELYFQECFGELGSGHPQPTSPIIIGIANTEGISGGNSNPLKWQLAALSNCLSLYAHWQMIGVALYLYEYMGYVNSSDWSDWWNWISSPNVNQQITMPSLESIKTIVYSPPTTVIEPIPVEPSIESMSAVASTPIPVYYTVQYSSTPCTDASTTNLGVIQPGGSMQVGKGTTITIMAPDPG